MGGPLRLARRTNFSQMPEMLGHVVVHVVIRAPSVDEIDMRLDVGCARNPPVGESA